MQKPKILIVDDELYQLEAIIEILEIENTYRVLQAFNASIALKIAIKEMPDIIITDWEMPEMNGIELIKKLKANKKTADIPIIMCTGVMTSSVNLDTALQAGAVDYIRKPVDKIELIARIKASLNLSDSYKRIKKLNESKDRIFAIISHDLRGPLGSMKAFLEYMISEHSKFDHKKILNYLALLRNQSAAAFNILENLFEWARSQRNSIDFAPKNHKINPVIENNIDLLQNIADKKSIKIYNNASENLIANFDLAQISIVIRNLIANAIKFTPVNGEITVNAEQDEYKTLISVADTGIGISPLRLKKIFDDTVFETTIGTNNEKGSGLGLKLGKYFVEQHNGKLWVESEIKHGSVFKFSLPVLN